MPDDRTPGTRHEVERDNPYERERQFLEERLAPFPPKAEGAAAGGPPGPDAARLLEEPERRLPPDFRRRLVEQYRSRRRAEAAARRAARSVEDADEEVSEAGEAPEPPRPASAGRWIPIGPSVVRQGQSPARPPVSGRARAIAVATGGRRVYVGAGNGGVWRSDDAGQSWRSLMESESFDLDPPSVPKEELGADSLSCGALAIDPHDPDRIYVGTGEGVFFGYFGVGPIVSTDGGRTWGRPEEMAQDRTPLKASRFFALAVDPNRPDRVVAATDKGLYRREPDGEGGFHWVWKAPGGGPEETTSVVVARTGTTTTFYASGPNGQVVTSTDGETWQEVGAPYQGSEEPTVEGTERDLSFPGDDIVRVALAVQPTNPKVVYALVAQKNKKLHGLYRLNLDVPVWEKVQGVPADLFGDKGEWGGGDHGLAIAVDPVDVNCVYLGGMAVLVPIAGTEETEVCGALYRCPITFMGNTTRATPAHIGATVHADILSLVFAPDDPDTLWVGCDGGVFVSTNPAATDVRFQARNTGLATLQMHHLAQHPAEEVVLFCGTQDNGGLRFTGEPAWLYSAGGECGYSVVNWHDPYQVLSTWTDRYVRKSTDGGTRYSYIDVDVPLENGEPVRFYAPLAGTPHSRDKTEAGLVAFGSIRPWISYEFGEDEWQSIPKGKLADDKLDAEIRSLAFASARMLYAGTMGGGVYRFERPNNTSTRWTRTPLGPRRWPITDIAVDPADSSGRSIYVALGGTGDYRHVWHFNGTQSRWQQRSGPEAGHHDSLLDVHTNALVVDPDNPSHLYVGADIGIWRSTDAGATWSTFSSGLPDAAVLDLAFHKGRRLLRAATHGRGVYEYRVDATTTPRVELHVRDHQLDPGRAKSGELDTSGLDGRDDPTRQGRRVYHWAGPDIKLDTPDATGRYQLSTTQPATVDFLAFTDALTDDARKVAIYPTQATATRVYVQVHNRGWDVADNVRVMLLVANAPLALPALPDGLAANLRSGTPINTPGWQTVGFATLDGVRPGCPKIAAFQLRSDRLPAPDQAAGDNHHCLLALVHHPDDPFTATQTSGDRLTVTERKAAHKHLRTLQFVEDLEQPPPVVLRARLNNPDASRRLLTDLVVDLENVHQGERHPYPGRVRVVLPKLQIDGDFAQRIEGLKRLQGTGELKNLEKWAKQQRQLLEDDQDGIRPHNQVFVQQQIREIDQILAPGTVMLQAVGPPNRPKQVAVRRIVMAPGASHTVFLLLDRPNVDELEEHLRAEVRVFNVDIMQFDVEQQPRPKRLGGLSSRIELAWPTIYHPG
jgi:photosystem II stability/assembly factor-like uncharacterized protein